MRNKQVGIECSIGHRNLYEVNCVKQWDCHETSHWKLEIEIWKCKNTYPLEAMCFFVFFPLALGPVFGLFGKDGLFARARIFVW